MSTADTIPLSPLARYQQDLASGTFQPDAAQLAAVNELQRIYDVLTQRYQASQTRKGLGRRKLAKEMQQPVHGLYLWGGVGRGKTYLMDLFCEALPFRRKLRMHFHRFMQRVHKELNELKGEKNPLEKVADRIQADAVVICFDEFFVTDITDAMLLKGLFEQLFARGVTLVATSNIIPDRLYENGLQRERFLPAIELVKTYCQVLNVDSGIDYRLRVLTHVELYHHPLDEAAARVMQQSFTELAQGTTTHLDDVIINERIVNVRARTEDVLWCDFAELCEKPRSASDYIEIAKEYHTVLLSNVPIMGEKNDDATRRFINLIDELYDRQVKLIITAEASIEQIYSQGKLNFEIKRTRSRLQEMQSQEYLELPHLP
ncbi:cell division protein ZapE [Agitococcus lubricus]|uniref:Cell division protein ZapE n=1 Tax=Agitococcus lubricus TaxID=1077255 RepID=A0A2T5J0N0_9GAMM|nr:cell division protein ZapE [Agitococcus lubricus]PTQ89893.1 cell division protein ZapE [Agitococcus lubricus]